jgi:hypothetical protein
MILTDHPQQVNGEYGEERSGEERSGEERRGEERRGEERREMIYYYCRCILRTKMPGPKLHD